MDPAAFALASALVTRKNTSTGATAFRADTNSVPRSPTASAFGNAMPSTAPTASPATMRLIRLMSLYLRASALKSTSAPCLRSLRFGRL